MVKKKIVDFGEKLGGAKKDMWIHGICEEHLTHMTLEEQKEYVTRDGVWALTDAIKQVGDGMDPFVAYFIRCMRKTVKKAPVPGTDALKNIREYVRIANVFKERVEAIRTEADILSFKRTYYDDFHAYCHIVEVAKIYNFFCNWGYHKCNCERTNFPYITKNSNGKKKNFLPPQLEKVERTGKNYLNGRMVDDELWQKTFSFRGVEFGNWTSQKHRQVSLNMAYEALLDLAAGLEIENTDVAFNSTLGLGFGSRGYSAASAHYELDREVINLTKMHGAGCLAHEWAHALDDKIGKFYGSQFGKLASEASDKSMLPLSFRDILAAMKTADNGEETDFYKGSVKFDGQFRKDAHGYWSSACEMFARAFACYLKDICDFRSDYLFALADTYVFEFEDMKACAIPQGEERIILDGLFDQLFYDLKKDGFFRKRSKKPEVKKEVYKSRMANGYAVELHADANGQLMFVLQ